MAEEFVANFSIEDNQQTANFSLNNNNSISANFGITPLEKDHDTLYNRDKANQHQISAITNLEERLTDLENQDKYFIYEQEIPSATWVINHTLDKCSSVMVVDTAGSVQIPEDITYNSNTQITISFLAGFAGKAYLN